MALVIIFMLQKVRTKCCLSPDITVQDVPLTEITHTQAHTDKNTASHYNAMRLSDHEDLLQRFFI